MTFDWQNSVALAMVLTATGYLFRRSWRTLAKKREAGCGACGNCPAEGAKPAGGSIAPNQHLVQLTTFTKPRTKE